MFRALLWKEWRELWALPVAAAPLAAMSFFVTKAATQEQVSLWGDSPLVMTTRLSPIVWETGFAIWLLLSAIYIPGHVYARERELNTAEFLSCKPIDRFRLWWSKLLIGITSLAGVGLILAAVIMTLKLFYSTDHDFYYHGSYIVRSSIFAAALLFSLSSFFSSLFRKQLNSMVGVVLTLVFLGAFLWMLRAVGTHDLYPVNRIVDLYPDYKPDSMFSLFQRYSFPKRMDYLSILALIVCPSLLFASLVVFVKGNMASQSRSRIALTYSLVAIVALSTTALGVSRLSAGAEPLTWQATGRINNATVSPDGTRILVSVGQRWLRGSRTIWSEKRMPGSAVDGPLVSINLPERRIGIIETDRGYYRLGRRPRGIKDDKVLLYSSYQSGWSRIFPRKIILSNLEGTWEKVLFTGRWFDFENQSRAYTWWSIDGRHIALTSLELNAQGFNAVFDSGGNVLWKQSPSKSNKAFPIILGWDGDSRLYLVSYSGSVPRKVSVSRVRPGEWIPEEVPALSGEGHYPQHPSPDGRWIRNIRMTEPRGKREYWMYDTKQETHRFIAENLWHPSWSPDGQFLAYAVPVAVPAGTESPDSKSCHLFLYEPNTGESHSLSTDALRDLQIEGWSPSGEYLLFRHSAPTEERHSHLVYDPMAFYVFSATTRQTMEVSREDAEGRYAPWPSGWVADDRLMWNIENRLITTDIDGSNPEEIFRIEDGTMYLYGEEQS